MDIMFVSQCHKVAEVFLVFGQAYPKLKSWHRGSSALIKVSSFSFIIRNGTMFLVMLPKLYVYLFYLSVSSHMWPSMAKANTFAIYSKLSYYLKSWQNKLSNDAFINNFAQQITAIRVFKVLRYKMRKWKSMAVKSLAL